jgi:hypothetical protein
LIELIARIENPDSSYSGYNVLSAFHRYAILIGQTGAEAVLPLRDCNILLFGVLSDLSVLVLLGQKIWANCLNCDLCDSCDYSV